MRYGEMTAFEERPHSPYYGNADATPLYVVLLDEYERWTGDTKLVRDLEHEARAALNWIDEYADLHGQRLHLLPAPQRGDRPGEPVLEGLLGLDLLPRRAPARLPARDLRAAGLRLRRQDARRPAGARGLERPRVRRPAGAARRPSSSAASTATSGSPDGEYFALALDADGSQVDALASNIGHLLWSGIVDKSKAKAVARHLLGPRLFSGWGVRTLAEGEGALQPDRLPRRHGLAVRQLVHRLGPAPLRLQGGGRARSRPASSTPPTFFDGRLPEAFGGYERDARPSTRCSTRPRAARRPGRPARRCCCCARCSAWSRSATTSIVDPALPERHRPARAARHPGPLGPHRRLRPRPRRGGREARETLKLARMSDGFPFLPSPFELRGKRLPSRVVFTAHTVSYDQGHVPGERARDYYAARAAGGAGLIVMEPLPAPPNGGVTPQTYRYDDDRFVPALRRVVDAVHVSMARSSSRSCTTWEPTPTRSRAGSERWRPARGSRPAARTASGRCQGEDIDQLDRRATSPGARAAIAGGADGVERMLATTCSSISSSRPRATARADGYGGALGAARASRARSSPRRARRSAGAAPRRDGDGGHGRRRGGRRPPRRALRHRLRRCRPRQR